MPRKVDQSEIQRIIKSGTEAELSAAIEALPNRAITRLIDDLPNSDVNAVVRVLSPERSSAVFESLDHSSQAVLLGNLDESDLLEIFPALDPEEQAWLLEEAPVKVGKKLNALFSQDDLAPARKLLEYPKDSIGRRMSPLSAVLRSTQTIESAIQNARDTTADQETLIYLPVVGQRGELLGSVSLLELFKHAEGRTPSGSDSTVESLLNPDVPIAVFSENDELVARWALEFGFQLTFIVDEENKPLGILPLSDAARIDLEALDQDIARQGGSEPLGRPYLLTSVVNVAKSRIVWLLVLAVSAVLTVQVLEIFEATLAEVVALALFIPLLTGVGGNTGSQAATTVTRAIGLGNVSTKDVGKVAFKELRTGFILGCMLAAIAFAVGSVFYGPQIGGVIALTLLINCPMAATVGGVIPLVAKACKVDPAVFSTPFISTFCDATGLLIYFNIARIVLGI